MSAAFTAAGASRMTILELADGRVRVVCPVCRFERVYARGQAPASFEHGRPDCPVLQLVTAALQEFQLDFGAEVHG